MPAGALVVCEIDRGAKKVFKQKYHVDMVPTLLTGNNYLFILSTDDLDAVDADRKMFRWLTPFERPALQGVSPYMSTMLTVKELVPACGNEHPVPLIVRSPTLP